MATKTLTRDPTAASRARRMRERRSRGFFIVGVEVCDGDLKRLAKHGYLDVEPGQVDREQIANAIGKMLDNFDQLHS